MGKNLNCEKCGKDFAGKSGHYYRHVEKCKGNGGEAAPEDPEKVLLAQACNPDEAMDPEELRKLFKVIGAKRTTDFLKYFFTPAERSEISDEMAQGYVRRQAQEEELTQIKAQYKSDITKLDTVINDAARKLNMGYEMRNVNCIALMDHERKIVVMRRIDTGEVVKVREMNLSEMQRDLPLGDEAEQPPAPGETLAGEESAAPAQ